MEDELLKQLALEVKQHPPESLQRRRALNRLLSRLSLNKLKQPQRGQWTSSNDLYKQLLDEAYSRTLMEVARKIDSYDPDRADVLAWVNNKLDYRFKDVVQDYYRAGRTGISRESLKSGTAKILSLDQLELDFPSEANEPDLLRQFISEDVEKRLMRPIRGRPKATFQFLLLSKLDGKTWDEISEILGPPPISKQTLSSFFNRQLQSLMPYFLKGLSD
jgi:DNA-directed RNA polymerase specialized sigma24 family protein